MWTASGATNTGRKRLLGLFIEDATLTRHGSGVTVALRMRGGRTFALDPVQLPPPAEIRETRPKTIAALAGLLDTHTDGAVPLALNHAGHTNPKGEPYTVTRVGKMRRTYGLPSFVEREWSRLRDQGFETALELAERLGVSRRTVYKIGRDAHDNRSPVRGRLDRQGDGWARSTGDAGECRSREGALSRERYGTEAGT